MRIDANQSQIQAAAQIPARAERAGEREPDGDADDRAAAPVQRSAAQVYGPGVGTRVDLLA